MKVINVMHLTDINGRKIALAGDKFEMTTAGTASQWNGARTNIRVVGGNWYSVIESVQEICQQLNERNS